MGQEERLFQAWQPLGSEHLMLFMKVNVGISLHRPAHFNDVYS